MLAISSSLSASSVVPSSSNSFTNSPLPKVEIKQEKQQEDVSSKIMDSKEVKNEADPPVIDLKAIIHSKERVEKFKKYEADYKQYLMAKYFSDKTIFGGNIFDVKMNIDGQTIMASRLPPYQSYLDPTTFDELNSKESTSSVKTEAGVLVKPEVGDSVKPEAGDTSKGAPSTEGN